MEIQEFEGDAIRGPTAPMHVPAQPAARVPRKKRSRDEAEKRERDDHAKPEPAQDGDEDEAADPHVDVRVEGALLDTSIDCRTRSGKIDPVHGAVRFESQCLSSDWKRTLPFANTERPRKQVGRARDRKEWARILLN